MQFKTSELPSTQLNLWCVWRKGQSVICIRNFKGIDLSVQIVTKIWKFGHMTRPRPLRALFCGSQQDLPYLYQIWSRQLYSFKSNNVSENFEIWTRDRGHAPFEPETL